MKEQDPLEREAYCRRLGHFVPFRYCLKPGQDTPCFKVLDCWWQLFDVVDYLKEHLSENIFEKLTSNLKPPDKIESILDVVARVKKD